MITRLYPDQDLYLWTDLTHSLTFRLNLDLARSPKCKNLHIRICMSSTLIIYQTDDNVRRGDACNHQVPEDFDGTPFLEELARMCDMRVVAYGAFLDGINRWLGCFTLER